MTSALDRLIESSDLRCTICGAKAGECSCWSKCHCGWSYQRGSKCNNPIHAKASAIVSELAKRHPQTMRAASGGFRRTAKVHIERYLLNKGAHPIDPLRSVYASVLASAGASFEHDLNSLLESHIAE